MAISKTYDPSAVEDKWYQYWLDNKFFKSTPDEREPYTIVIPPPNVTGVLHMGHMLNNTIQDVLIRKARMQGKNACWVPGTDHASIATEAKVVAMLKEQGIEKKDISREEFLKYAWEWKEKYGGIILEQLKKLGASCDWDKTSFTMDENYSDSVLEAFVKLYHKGLIYRGVRMVNWDPQGKTALSDEEVIFKETQSKLYYIKYEAPQPPEGESFSPSPKGRDSLDSPLGVGGLWITIATVRPETILGDTAICVNPNDERYKHLIGKTAIVPIVNREIPIIADEYVLMDFGTGALKVTPAHDLNDYELGIKHNLQIIDTIDDDGTLNENCGVPKYVGKDRFAVRREIVKELEEMGQLIKVEEYKNQVGTSERTGAVIEPKLSMQWFMKMKELSKPAWDAVMQDEIKLYPSKFKNMYNSWMENVRDWCVSRQLWWGHQIPAYYLPNGEIIVAKTKAEALEIANSKLPDITGYQLAADRGNIPQEDVPVPYTEADLRQEEDVLDTWASSWLWPIAVFGNLGKEDTADLAYYYPTSTLVTAPEILFFWVARMIIAGYEFRGQIPFKDVYLTGIVRDKLGRKMSKSLGNSPDPIELMEKYSTDGVRTGMLFSSPAGNDLPFDEKLCEQGRNFANKIWNSYRLIEGWTINEASIKSDPNGTQACLWFQSKLQLAIIEIEELYQEYRISEALLKLYKLFWDDFCAYFLELIKPENGEINKGIYKKTIAFMETLLKLLHPFMPFITEEIWHQIKERDTKESICVSAYPLANIAEKDYFEKEAAKGQIFIDAITEIRNIRNEKQIPMRESIDVFARLLDPNETDGDVFEEYKSFIKKLANVEKIELVKEKVEQSASFVLKNYEFYVPLLGKIDVEKEKENLQKELEYTIGFRDSVLKKLSNEKFVANAKPEIVANERQKLADADAKIKALEEGLKGL